MTAWVGVWVARLLVSPDAGKFPRRRTDHVLRRAQSPPHRWKIRGEVSCPLRQVGFVVIDRGYIAPSAERWGHSKSPRKSLGALKPNGFFASVTKCALWPDRVERISSNAPIPYCSRIRAAWGGRIGRNAVKFRPLPNGIANSVTHSVYQTKCRGVSAIRSRAAACCPGMRTGTRHITRSGLAPSRQTRLTAFGRGRRIRRLARGLDLRKVSITEFGVELWVCWRRLVLGGMLLLFHFLRFCERGRSRPPFFGSYIAGNCSGERFKPCSPSHPLVL